MKRLLIGALSALCFPVAAWAQAHCGSTTATYDTLANTHGETRVASGLQPDGLLIELWANPQTGSWTLFYTMPGGVSCALSSGEAFEQHAPAPNI